MHRDSSEYYVDLAPDLFRLPDEDGLVEFLEPSPEDNSATSLLTVAEIDRDVVLSSVSAFDTFNFREPTGVYGVGTQF